MKHSVQRFKADGYSTDATVIFLPQEKNAFAKASENIRELWSGAASALDSGDVSGARDAVSIVYSGSKKSPRLILIGLGEEGVTNIAERLRRASAVAMQRAAALKCGSVAVILPALPIDIAETAQAIVEGGILGTYAFDKYFTEKKREKFLKKVTLMADDADVSAARKGMITGESIAAGVVLARDLANAPANEIYPESLAKRAKELSDVGVKVTVLNKAQITRLKMGGLLAVNQGSVRPPFFIVMEWNGGKRNEAPVVLVGKGITFDTGGISIKPAAGMGDMKMDMGGSAAVIGTLRAVAELKLPMNIVGLVPTTENMPSGSAYLPGDVVTFMNGKTAEIDNTDAEGRLVLADALTYAERYKPQAVIDLATLTGACVIALGNAASALMGNTPELLMRLREAGDRTCDRVAELPLLEEYEDLIKSDIADVKNSGGRAAGSITAALFLQHFIGDYRWAHIDIAGTGMIPKPFYYLNKGGTGAGVRLLIETLRSWKPIQ